MFLPYKLDLPIENSPTANIGLIAVCVVFFVLTHYSSSTDILVRMMVLDGWNLVGVLGHIFLHADLVHLLGNMYLLWIFGNAICSKLKGIFYIPLFLFFGSVAAAFHNIFDGNPAVGASGALFGIIGFYFALYPTNRISCFWFFIHHSRTFELPAFLIIGFWVLQDVLGLFGPPSLVAHIAHLGGFIAGVGIGYWLVKSGRLAMNDYDLKTLSDFI